jgi:transcriptional regulator with XRE-family HTH domain
MSARSNLLDHGDPALFGEIVRTARHRQGLSLAEAADLAGTSPSHLSRLERGKRLTLSRDLLSRIATTLEVDTLRLFGAAGLLPPPIERALADPEVALALADGDRLPYRTRWLLRRRHLGALAEQEFTVPAVGPVDVETLLTDRGYTVIEQAGSERRLEIDRMTVRYVGDPPPVKRFLLAHALAHSVLEVEPRCCLDNADLTYDEESREAEATAMASFILVPTNPLAIAVREETARFDVWRGGTGALLESVAGRFGAPTWIVARRVGEDGFFADAAHLEDI